MDVEALAAPRRLLRRAGGALLLAACACACAAAAPPTTLGSVLGNGLLCRDETSNRYFYDYMVRFFGPPYKREGGAWWFRTPDAMLWGTEISEVIVSDDTFPLTFVGAVAETTPDKLEESIIAQVGLHYAKIDSSRFPVREARPGSRIVYFDRKAKIFCAKFKPLPPALR
ncbi:MAG: hypothetical protein V4724_02190 [Pseudomonadota bacterium]